MQSLPLWPFLRQPLQAGDETILLCGYLSLVFAVNGSTPVRNCNIGGLVGEDYFGRFITETLWCLQGLSEFHHMFQWQFLSHTTSQPLSIFLAEALVVMFISVLGGARFHSRFEELWGLALTSTGEQDWAAATVHCARCEILLRLTMLSVFVCMYVWHVWIGYNHAIITFCFAD